MAQLNSSNITNGNTVQPNDLLQLYNALTAGGGYNVSISGSITGSATTASFVTTAQTASFVTTAQTASFVTTAQTASFVLSSSYALSSSYSSGSSLITSQRFINSSTPSTVSTGNFQFIAGGGVLNTGKFTSSVYIPLAGKIIGQNAWINVSYFGDPALLMNPEQTLIVNISSSGAILIEQVLGNDNATIVWTGIYV
jgi:hypothetical protein